jgi:hypothetical protein
VISEDIEFVTDSVSFRGGYGVANLPCSKDADLVLAEGDQVSLHRAEEMLSDEPDLLDHANVSDGETAS